METIKVKDLMVPLEQYVCVSEQATLYEAVVALEAAQAKSTSSGHPHRAILICDKDNNVVGKMGLLDLLRSLEPRYSENPSYSVRFRFPAGLPRSSCVQ